MNLLVNARQALEGHASPREVRIVARTDTETLKLEVGDNGPGIGEAIWGRVFDPFFTTKPIGAGTGIGLGVSRGIVEAHGGTLLLEPSESGGARFVVRLPLGGAPDVDAPAPPTAADATTAAGERTVLIVDDEPEVATLLADMLTAQGFRCQSAHTGTAARSLLERHDYDAILCDVRMPDVDGPALFAWLIEHKPHLRARVAFVTGDTLGPAAGGFLVHAGRPILEKPFLPAELRRLMAELTELPAS